MLSIVVLNVKNGTNTGIRIPEYVSYIVASISVVRNCAKSLVFDFKMVN